MKVWLITVGEPLPIDGEERLLRTGILADTLVRQGHDVLWWTSTFNHPAKKHRFNEDTQITVGDHYRLFLLHGTGYRNNISFRRILNHRTLGKKFRRLVEGQTRPDIIVCSFPTIELSAEAVRYGRRTGVPVVLDIRDLWPDIFTKAVPRGFRWLAGLAMHPMQRATRFAMDNADHLIAVSAGMLRWGLAKAGREIGEFDRVVPLAYRKLRASADSLAAAERELKAKGVDPSATVCWFIGIFGYTYDVSTIIEGARELHQRGFRTLQFVLSGDGDRRDEWTKQARGLPNVVFTGWVNEPEIAYLMSIAHVGLVAYDSVPETLPNKLFEYFSAGIPVLSSIGGDDARQLIVGNECGANYQAKDPSSFVQALLPLVNDEERRRQMGANARKLFESEFDGSVVYPRLIEYLVERAKAYRRSERTAGVSR